MEDETLRSSSHFCKCLFNSSSIDSLSFLTPDPVIEYLWKGTRSFILGRKFETNWAKKIDLAKHTEIGILPQVVFCQTLLLVLRSKALNG